jgi:GDPmannose 4,6-dehydratase
VTRKITRGLAYISQGLQDCLYIGNLNALRDWGHARDYVRLQWLILQQEEPEDFVIATGAQHSVRDFVRWSAAELGITLCFDGEGLDEVGIVDAVEDQSSTAVKPGDIIVRVDPRYFRPAEVQTLLGDPTKAHVKLGWVPKVTARQLCSEMVAADLAIAKQHALLASYGYPVSVSTGI